MFRPALLVSFLFCLLFPNTTFAYVESLVPAEPVGEGGETTSQALRVYDWPVEASGYTCDNDDDYYNENCLRWGAGEDVVYKFMSPLGTGKLDVFLCTTTYFKSTVYLKSSSYWFDVCSSIHSGVPGCGYYSSEITDLPITDYSDLYYVCVDGHDPFSGPDHCGNYSLFLDYTPVQ